MIDPRIIPDVDGRYCGGTIKSLRLYVYKRTIFSGWTFWSRFMQTIINPALVSDQLNSLITLAEQTDRHYYERWELLNDLYDW